MFVQANAFGGEGESRFCCVRYGNVLGTRGSVIPIFLEQSKRGKITLTDRRMTRFCITLDAAVRFAILCIEQMQGGEIFILKTSSFCLADLAESIGRNCQIDYVGMRPGEKVHEVLVSEDESRNALELENMYVIQPVHPWWKKDNWMQGRALPEGFRYASDLSAD